MDLFVITLHSSRWMLLGEEDAVVKNICITSGGSWAVFLTDISAAHCEEWKALSEELLSALLSRTLAFPDPLSCWVCVAQFRETG